MHQPNIVHYSYYLSVYHMLLYVCGRSKNNEWDQYKSATNSQSTEIKIIKNQVDVKHVEYGKET